MKYTTQKQLSGKDVWGKLWGKGYRTSRPFLSVSPLQHLDVLTSSEAPELHHLGVEGFITEIELSHWPLVINSISNPSPLLGD